MRGEGSTKPGDRLVEASVCCTERMVWASADSAAACTDEKYQRVTPKFSFLRAISTFYRNMIKSNRGNGVFVL